MNTIFRRAWARFGVITGVISDAQAQVIAIAFYFTIAAPFSLAARLSGDRLGRHEPPAWITREPVAHGLDAARRQG